MKINLMKELRSAIQNRQDAQMKVTISTLRLVSIGLALGLVILFAAGALAQHFSEWSTPVSLGPPVNTEFFEVCHCVTKTGLSLYFGSNRPGGIGNVDIYVSQRPSTDAPWGPPRNLGPTINSPSIDNCPFVTPDGHTLIFLSNRPGGPGGIDLYVSSRRNKRNDFAWEMADPLAAMNTPFNEFGPTGYEDEETGDLVLFFTSDRPGGPGGPDIYMSRTASDGTLLPPTLVAELSSSAQDLFANVRKDGRELFLSSDRNGTIGNLDFWVASRESTSDPWSVPENLGPIVNSTGFEQRPAISWDAQTLIFTSNRDGNFDLYQTTRTRRRGPRQ
jgi:Tol biopolymer transport system component